ncbi:MAG: DUF1499 domain-containing protein [Clostridiaceae bacterium]
MIFVYIILAVVAVVIIKMVSGNMTTPKNLGVKDGRLAEMPKSPNAVSSQTDKEEYYVKPFPFKEDLEVSKAAILQSVEQYGGGEVVINEPNYIRILFTTAVMHYHDDMEFYFNEEAKIVEFRSASRIGYSDMGLNKERYNKLYKYYTNK